MPPTTAELAQFMHALGQRESGNNYQAIGTDQGNQYGVAQGRFQIMSKIWPEWARQAGYAGADWRDPRAQDAVAAYKMSKYYDRYNGDWSLVAAAWLGGQGTADAIVQGNSSTWGKSDGFTDVRSYTQDIMANMRSTPTPSKGRRMQPGQPDGLSLEQHSVNALAEQQDNAVEQSPQEASQVAASVLGQLSRIAKENADDPETRGRLQEAIRQVYRPFDEDRR